MENKIKQQIDSIKFDIESAKNKIISNHTHLTNGFTVIYLETYMELIEDIERGINLLNKIILK